MARVLLVLLWPVGLVVIIGSGAMLARRAAPPTELASPPARASRQDAGGRPGPDHAAAPLRDAARFLAAAVAGLAAAFGLISLVGVLVVHAGPAIDEPVWQWTVHHRWHPWYVLMDTATQLGYKWTTWGAAAACAVILALMARQRRWLMPAALGSLVVAEHFLTRAVVEIFHRPGPPGSAGTFPSGGTDRAVAVYGLIAYLLWRELSARRPAAIWAATVVAALGFNEAYSRGYLAVHWLTDILSGFLYGCLLLCVFAVAVRLAGGPAAAATSRPRFRLAAPSAVPTAPAGENA